MISDWQIKILGDVCEFYNGKAHEKIIDESGKYIVINSKFISSNGEIVKKTNSMLFPLYTGDIVMVMSDVPNGQALSKCFLVEKDDTYSLNQRICAIRSTNFDKKFLYYQLSRNRYFLEFNNGENQTNLRKNEILNCPLLIPSLPEQKRIVGILDKAFAAISTAKANAEKNLQNDRELFESYLQGIFANPGDGWEEKSLEEIGKTQTGTTPKTSDKENYGNYIPFITPADIDIYGDGRIRYRDDGLSEQGLKNGRKMEKDSILMVCIGASIGKVGYVNRDVSCNQQINSLTVKKGFCPKFFYYALSTKDFFEQVIKNSAQTTLPIINKGKWQKLSISYPFAKEEQESIVAKLDELSAETKKLEAIYQQKLADLDELKQSVLQKAFNGELAGACA